MIPFVKAHACGNDFLLIEEIYAERRHDSMARALCHRTTSVGADGIEFLERRPAGPFLRLFNADGTEAELSGNGTRCVAAWLAFSENVEQVTFGTHGGPRSCRVIDAEQTSYLIESSMGLPRVMPRTIVLPENVEVSGYMVNVGNPHFVIFVETEDFSSHGLSWQDMGRRVSTDRLFQHGTNVEFVRIRSRDEIEFRIYERGCGPTMSSGTGTCASSAAAIAAQKVSRELRAVAEGGTQSIFWPDDASEMKLTGPAEIICKGEVSFR